MNDLLKARIYRASNTSVILLAGEVDVSTEATLRATFDQVLAGSGGVVLDMASVGFLDAHGVDLIVELRRQLEVAHRALWLAAPSAPVQRVLELCGRLDVLRVETSVPRALAHATRHRDGVAELKGRTQARRD